MVVGQEKELLHGQLSRVHEDIERYNQQIFELGERLERYKRKYAEKKQQATSKLNTSK